MSNTTNPRLLTTTGAARVANVSGDTVRRWERAGLLPAQRTEGGIRLYDPADVARVAAQRLARDRAVVA